MRINIDARETDIEPALNWIGSLVGAALDKRVADFEAQERNNPLLIPHFRDTFALEFALAKARKYRPPAEGRRVRSTLRLSHPGPTYSRCAADERPNALRRQIA